MADDASSFSFASARCFSSFSVPSAGGTDGASAGNASLSPVVSARCFPFSFVASTGDASARSASGAFASDALSSPVVSTCQLLSSPVASVDGASAGDTGGACADSTLSSPIAGGGPSSAISGGGSLFSMLLTGSQALFLPSTPSHVCCNSLSSLPLFHFSLPFLSMPFARNPNPFIGKRLFD